MTLTSCRSPRIVARADARLAAALVGLASTLVAPPAAAQARFTSPPGVGTDGDSVVSSLQPFHVSTNGRRFQYIVDDVRDVPGVNGESISTISLRPDPSAGASTARTANVAIVLDHADFTAVSPTFTQNYSGNETTHALGQVNLPATAGGAGFTISFPLLRSFLYFGTHNAPQPAHTALLVEFQTTGVNGGTLYSLDCADGTEVPVVGSSVYLGLQPCVVPPHTGGFDIVRHGPTSSGGQTTLGQHALRGPPSSFGILAVGIVDPDTNYGGLLCAPSRASPEVQVNVVSDAQGAVGGFANPVDLTFPDLVPAQSLRVYTQFVFFDPARARPELPVSLSDAIRFDVTPPMSVDRRTIYATGSATANLGTLTAQFVPVLQFN